MNASSSKREKILNRMAEITGASVDELRNWYINDPLEDLPKPTLKAAADDYKANREQYRKVQKV